MLVVVVMGSGKKLEKCGACCCLSLSMQVEYGVCIISLVSRGCFTSIVAYQTTIREEAIGSQSRVYQCVISKQTNRRKKVEKLFT